MDDGDKDAPATSLLRPCSGDDGAGSAPTYDGCCRNSAMKEGGGPKLDAWGGSRPPPSLACVWHTRELAALDDGERGGSRSRSEHLPDVLQDLDGHGAIQIQSRLMCGARFLSSCSSPLSLIGRSRKGDCLLCGVQAD